MRRPGRKIKHHIDKRADKVVSDSVGDDDELLKTRHVADWLDVSTQWLEIGRHQNYGPPFVRVGSHSVRYRRSDVLDWLKSRTHHSTAEYTNRKTAAA